MRFVQGRKRTSMKENEKEAAPKPDAQPADVSPGKVDMTGAGFTDTPGEKTGDGDRTDVQEMDAVSDEGEQ
jgi:hypothetical protein